MGASHVETVIYKGITFRRYPEAKRRADRVYFIPGQADRARGIGRLHQEIWKDAHGPIPEGYEVHHKDHNPDNNDLSNLECVPGEEHRAYHIAQGPTEAQRAARRINQRATAEWHGSAEGRAWHARHCREIWAAAEERSYACEQCGGAFTSRDTTPAKVKYCSNNCRAAARRASGVDDEDRTCVGCGKTFRTGRYSKTQNCSRKCAWVVRRAKTT